MFVGVVALRPQQITECHNSYIHSQSLLTSLRLALTSLTMHCMAAVFYIHRLFILVQKIYMTPLCDE